MEIGAERTGRWPVILMIAAAIGVWIVSGGLARVEAQNGMVVVSAANYSGDAVASEQIVAGFGSGMTDVTAIAGSLPLPTEIGGTRVRVKDSQGVERLAPLFFVSPNQINFQIPVGTAAGAATIEVLKNNAVTSSGSAAIQATAPGLFSADASGKGLASANLLRVKGDNTQSYEPVGRYDAQQAKFVPIPIDPGTDQLYLILYGTGFRNHGNLSGVSATVGGQPAEVLFAGAQGNFAGLDQLNIRLPGNLNGGESEIVLTIGGRASNAVRITMMAPSNPYGERAFLATLRPEGNSMSPASGYATLRLSGDETSAVLRFTYSNLTTPETSAHIHGPANPGQNGAILFDLDTAVPEADGSMKWTFEQVGATTVPQILDALKTGRLYLNIHSSKYPSGEIRGHFGAVNGSQTFTPPDAPPALPGGKPTLRDAARFLTQATFGPKASEINALTSKGFETWLNEQFAKPTASHLSYLDVTTAGKKDIYQQEMMESFWKQAVTGDDQLRQRVVFALSQILVVSFRSNLEGEPFALAGYMDLLGRNAFGNFRQLLEEVTLSPAMGRYLDHLQNDKEDPATGRNPNENYAREVLQLFSIGLYRLHPDGTLMLDGSGLPIATYDQETVKGFAHVFTGWSYGWFQKTEHNWHWPDVWQNGTQFWRVPMQVWPNHHSTLSKRLLDGIELPSGQTPEKDLRDALDNIFNHPNVGPFISRQLIQRLVTSNPSPGYVYRVAQKFNNNGSGVRGDMKAVIRTILTDYEARSLDVVANQGYGKMREPVLRFSHLLRAFNYTCPCGTFPIYWMDSPEYAIGQNPLRAPTVFNFFEPNYSHAGHLASAGLHSPEFQITNDTSVIGISDFFHYVVRDGFKWEKDKPLTPDYTSLLPMAANPAQLIDHLDLVMTSQGMSAGLRNMLVTVLGAMPSNDPRARVTTAVHLILTSPDYVIQK
ncbi:MAG: DUF1800 family protein [Acidobacteriota bacterium]|nr:MAG: DUF1800 family protein [Acidobacteriota bacterium]